jgi:DEAD/DEAH box helicase domain-containing protein
MSDTLVFDIETQNFFTDPGVGWNNFDALKISVVGVYSYAQDKYHCFEEGQMKELAELFLRAERLVGFASNRYDVPVLNLYFRKLKDREALNLWAKDRVDLLEEIERQTGARISLNRLAEANLGIVKEGHGSDAVKLYEQGDMETLKKYCLKDVEITKKLYDIYLRDKSLLVPQWGGGEPVRLEFSTAGLSPRQGLRL